MRNIRLKDLGIGKRFAFKDSLEVVEIDGYLPIFRKIIINVGKESKDGIYNEVKGVANTVTGFDLEKEVFEVS